VLRLWVDFNTRENGDQDRILLRVGVDSPINKIDEFMLSVGQLVIIECADLECQAILRWSGEYNRWVADIVPGTCVDLPKESWARSETKL
jgi:hypothetical protein